MNKTTGEIKCCVLKIGFCSLDLDDSDNLLVQFAG